MDRSIGCSLSIFVVDFKSRVRCNLLPRLENLSVFSVLLNLNCQMKLRPHSLSLERNMTYA